MISLFRLLPSKNQCCSSCITYYYSYHLDFSLENVTLTYIKNHIQIRKQSHNFLHILCHSAAAMLDHKTKWYISPQTIWLVAMSPLCALLYHEQLSHFHLQAFFGRCQCEMQVAGSQLDTTPDLFILSMAPLQKYENLPNFSRYILIKIVG
jgi:hypothetical protein